jgi:hypothetical protein
MTEKPGADDDALSPSQVFRLEEVCDRFEVAWKATKSTGQRPWLEDYLGGAPEPERSLLLHELIALDVDYRQSCPYEGARRCQHVYLGRKCALAMGAEQPPWNRRRPWFTMPVLR